MTENGGLAMKKRAAIISLCSIVVLAVIIFVFVWQNRMENRFPVWEHAPEITEQSGLKLTYLGMEDFETEQGNSYDRVMILEENTSGELFSYGLGFWLEYFYHGQWYVIYRPDAVPAVGCGMPAGQIEEEGFDISAGILSNAGKYRIARDNFGYCEFDVE